MRVKALVTGGLCGGVAFILQGCGGGGGGGGTTSTTTTTTFPKSWPRSGPEIAELLNEKYNAYDNITKQGDLGVYITMQHDDLHMYCGTPCHDGYADCILSVALYNKHVMLDGDKYGAHMKVFAGRSAGYVINSTLAETKYNKCAYIFDGASTFRLNRGCGDAAPAVGDGSCAKGKHSAYADLCSTGKTCTIDDPEIQPNSNCLKITRPWPNTTAGAPCYFTGPAFDYPRTNAKYDHIREMIENRIYNQGWPPGDNSAPNDACCDNRLAKWNEVVMDLRPLIADLKHDPALVIPAFVYIKGHKNEAEDLRKLFQDTYGVPGDTPLIYMDVTVDVMHQDKMGKPFVFEGETDAIEV